MVLGNAVWYARHRAPGQRLVSRFHLFERDTHYPAQLAAGDVDHVAFVGAHILREMAPKMALEPDAMSVVPNAVPAAHLRRPKLPGARFNLGILGISPWRKRLDLAVETLRLVREQDERFSLFVKGHLPIDYWWIWGKERDRYLALTDAIAADPLLARSVVFDGWGSDVAEWFRKIGSTLSPSDFESFHLAPTEGISSGSVPVIWPWEGADEIYPDVPLVTDPADAAAAILAASAAAEPAQRQRQALAASATARCSRSAGPGSGCSSRRHERAHPEPQRSGALSALAFRWPAYHALRLLGRRRVHHQRGQRGGAHPARRWPPTDASRCCSSWPGCSRWPTTSARCRAPSCGSSAPRGRTTRVASTTRRTASRRTSAGRSGSALVLTVGVASLGTLAISFGAEWLAQLPLGLSSDAEALRWAAVCGATGAVWRLLLNVPRYERRPRLFLGLSITRPVVVVGLSIWLVSAEPTVSRALIAMAIGNAAVCVIALAITVRQLPPRLRSRRHRGHLQPWRLLHPGDRRVLGHPQRRPLPGVDLLLDAEVARYRVASRIASGVSYFVSAFLMAWMPLSRTSLYEAVSRERGLTEATARILTYFMIACFGCC